MDAETIQNTINALPLETRKQVRECVSNLKSVLGEYDLIVAAAAIALVESHTRVVLARQEKPAPIGGRTSLYDFWEDR